MSLGSVCSVSSGVLKIKCDPQSLHEVNATNMDISCIDVLSHCSNVTSINLAFNSISDLSPCSQVTKLENINVSHNKIKSFKGMGNSNRNIKVINASHNYLKDVDSLEPADYQSLSELWICFNQISNLKQLLGHLNKFSSLTRLFLKPGNPCCDMETYRDTVIQALPGLLMLDARPVTEDERSRFKFKIENLDLKDSSLCESDKKENKQPTNLVEKNVLSRAVSTDLGKSLTKITPSKPISSKSRPSSCKSLKPIDPELELYQDKPPYKVRYSKESSCGLIANNNGECSVQWVNGTVAVRVEKTNNWGLYACYRNKTLAVMWNLDSTGCQGVVNYETGKACIVAQGLSGKIYSLSGKLDLSWDKGKVLLVENSGKWWNESDNSIEIKLDAYLGIRYYLNENKFYLYFSCKNIRHKFLVGFNPPLSPDAESLQDPLFDQSVVEDKKLKPVELSASELCDQIRQATSSLDCLKMPSRVSFLFHEPESSPHLTSFLRAQLSSNLLVSSLPNDQLTRVLQNTKLELDRHLRHMFNLSEQHSFVISDENSQAKAVVIEAALRKRYPMFQSEGFRALTRPPQLYVDSGLFETVPTSGLQHHQLHHHGIAMTAPELPISPPPYSRRDSGTLQNHKKDNSIGFCNGFLTKSLIRSIPMRSRVKAMKVLELTTPLRRSTQASTSFLSPVVGNGAPIAPVAESASTSAEPTAATKVLVDLFELDIAQMDKYVESDKQQGKLPTLLYLDSTHIDDQGKLCLDSMELALKMSARHNLWIHVESCLKPAFVDSFSFSLEKFGHDSSITITGIRDDSINSFCFKSVSQIKHQLTLLFLTWMLFVSPIRVTTGAIMSETYMLAQYLRQCLAFTHELYSIHFNTPSSDVPQLATFYIHPAPAFVKLLQLECENSLAMLQKFNKLLASLMNLSLPFNFASIRSISSLSDCINDDVLTNVFVFHPFEKPLELMDQMITPNANMIAIVDDFVSMLKLKLNFIYEMAANMRPVFESGLLHHRFGSANAPFEIFSLNTVADSLEYLSAFRCVPQILLPPSLDKTSPTEIAKFNPLLNSFNEKLANALRSSNPLFSISTTLAGVRCIVMKPPSEGSDSELETLAGLCHHMAAATDLPDEVANAMDTAVQRGIQEAEKRLQESRSVYISKNYSTRAILYHAVVSLPILGSVVSYWTGPGRKDSKAINLVTPKSHNRSLTVQETLPPDTELVIGTITCEEKGDAANSESISSVISERREGSISEAPSIDRRLSSSQKPLIPVAVSSSEIDGQHFDIRYGFDGNSASTSRK